jgi:hypothetical protein
MLIKPESPRKVLQPRPEFDYLPPYEEVPYSGALELLAGALAWRTQGSLPKSRQERVQQDQLKKFHSPLELFSRRLSKASISVENPIWTPSNEHDHAREGKHRASGLGSTIRVVVWLYEPPNPMLEAP